MPPPAKPVQTRRATDYVLEGSIDGRHLAAPREGLQPRQRHQRPPPLRPTEVRYLRLKMTAATEGEPPLLEEIETSG